MKLSKIVEILFKKLFYLFNPIRIAKSLFLLQVFNENFPKNSSLLIRRRKHESAVIGNIRPAYILTFRCFPFPWLYSIGPYGASIS